MTNGFGRVPLPAEMDAFETEVGGDQEFAILWNAENGSVVTDSDGDRAARGS